MTELLNFEKVLFDLGIQGIIDLSENSQNKDVVHQAKLCQVFIVGKTHKFLQLKVFVLEKLGSNCD